MPPAGCAEPRYDGAPAGLKLFNARQWYTLAAATRRLAPAHGGLDTALVADHLFAPANQRLKDQLFQLLDTLEQWPVLGGSFTRFTAMAPEAQDAYLRNWQTSSVGTKRQAFVGLNRLAQMVTYMDPATWQGIGFDGPWVGRIDVGLGLDNQGELAANPNPHVFARYGSA